MGRQSRQHNATFRAVRTVSYLSRGIHTASSTTKLSLRLQAFLLVMFGGLLLTGCVGSQNSRPVLQPDALQTESDRGLRRVAEDAESGEMQARHALVIGNSRYNNSPLDNPANDANAIAQSLNILRFEVTVLFDADRRQTIAAIRAFGQQLAESGGVGLFYYAGHAVQLDGRNYLIPVGANIQREHDTEHEAVDVNRVLSEMDSAGNQTNIVILDACRDNPFARSFRSTQSGLAQLDAAGGTLIAYATAPGKVAEDGVGVHGTYTKHLLQQMRYKGMQVETVFKRVRSAVIQETDGDQVPWESSSLLEEFYFSGGTSGLANYDENPPPPLKISPLPSSTSNVNPWMSLLEYQKPWYKRPYVWAGIIAGVAVIACSGGGEGGGRRGWFGWRVLAAQDKQLKGERKIREPRCAIVKSCFEQPRPGEEQHTSIGRYGCRQTYA